MKQNDAESADEDDDDDAPPPPPPMNLPPVPRSGPPENVS